MTVEESYLTRTRCQLTSTESVRPLFILGSYRSGTSLMRRTLNSSRCIHIAKETGYFPFLLSQNFSISELRIRINSFLQREGWSVFLTDEIISKTSMSKDPYAALYKEVCLLECSHIEQVKFWGDNTPYNLFVLPDLLSMFPDARIIYLYRDPRDVVSSIMPLNFRKNTAFLAAQELQNYIVNWLACKANVNPECYVEIAYEDFVKEPWKVVKQLEVFLGIDIPFEDVNTNSCLVSDIAFKHHGELHNEIHTHSVGKFHNVLSDEDIQIVEASLRSLMSHYGYENIMPYNPSPALLDNSRYLLKNSIMDVFIRIKRMFGAK